MVAVAPGVGGGATPQVANDISIAFQENVSGGGFVQGSAMQPAFDEPHSNLPFDPRMARNQFWYGAKNVTAGVITNDVTPLGGKVTMQNYGLSGTVAPFYCFFLFNPAEIDADYGFDQSGDGMLPVSQVSNTVGNGGGVMTQTMTLNLLFDRTYEVWNGPQSLPASANYGFGQDAVTLPKKGGPYKYGCLWDVWALERLCGIFRQVDGIPPQGPPTVQLLHVMTGGVNVANTMAGAGVGHTGAANQDTQITLDPAPSAIDIWGWMQSLSVQYTRFDVNMVPTRCAVSLGFQLTYAQPASTTAAGAPDPNSTSQAGG